MQRQTNPALNNVNEKPINGKKIWTDAVFTKVYLSSRETLFSAWTDADKVAQWWGPHGFTNPFCKWDAKPNGGIYIQMTAPDGITFPLTGFFYEVIPPEQMIFVTKAFADESGNAQVEVMASVIFTGGNEITKLTIEATVMKSAPGVYCFLETMYEGWKQSLEKLECFLSGKIIL
jgi:uncharacterized protein YndB with AHSA1/START domain